MKPGPAPREAAPWAATEAGAGTTAQRKAKNRGKRRGIDLKGLFASFDKIPDAGASYTIELCATLPVKGNPAASMNFSGGMKAGHCFIRIEKTNERDSVFEAFGFYPAGRLSPRDPLKAYPSCIRNNRRTVAHASLKTSMSATEFENVRGMALENAQSDYRLADFNCADFAVGIFTLVENIDPVPYPVTWCGIPIGYNRLPSRRQLVIKNTPHGLFQAIGRREGIIRMAARSSASPAPQIA